MKNNFEIPVEGVPEKSDSPEVGIAVRQENLEPVSVSEQRKKEEEDRVSQIISELQENSSGQTMDASAPEMANETAPAVVSKPGWGSKIKKWLGLGGVIGLGYFAGMNEGQGADRAPVRKAGNGAVPVWRVESPTSAKAEAGENIQKNWADPMVRAEEDAKKSGKIFDVNGQNDWTNPKFIEQITREKLAKEGKTPAEIEEGVKKELQRRAKIAEDAKMKLQSKKLDSSKWPGAGFGQKQESSAGMAKTVPPAKKIK